MESFKGILGSPVSKTDTGSFALIKVFVGAGDGDEGPKGRLLGSLSVAPKPFHGASRISGTQFGNCCPMLCPTFVVGFYTCDSISFPQYSMFFHFTDEKTGTQVNSFSHYHFIIE